MVYLFLCVESPIQGDKHNICIQCGVNDDYLVGFFMKMVN